MNPQGTSFIPQRPTQGNVKKRGVRKIYILTYVSFILFFGTILSTAGTFVFKTFENAKLEEQKRLLTLERDKFDESDMQSIRDLNRRMQNTDTLLNDHVSVVSIFSALEQSTLQSLKLTGFNYKRPNNSGIPAITIAGKTETFNSVMFQRTVLSGNPILADASFEEVAVVSSEPQEGVPADKTINFTITSEVDPSLIKFNPQESEVVPVEFEQDILPEEGDTATDAPVEGGESIDNSENPVTTDL